MCPLCPPLRPQMHPKSYQQNYLPFNFCTSVLYCQNRNTYVHQSLPSRCQYSNCAIKARDQQKYLREPGWSSKSVYPHAHLEVSPVYPHCRLWHVIWASKLQVQRPYSVVLRKREGLEGPVKSVPCLCDFALVHQKLAVVQPDTRHLHRRQGLERVEGRRERMGKVGSMRTLLHLQTYLSTHVLTYTIEQPGMLSLKHSTAA